MRSHKMDQGMRGRFRDGRNERCNRVRQDTRIKRSARSRRGRPFLSGRKVSLGRRSQE
jgi:hypothetical protein